MENFRKLCANYLRSQPDTASLCEICLSATETGALLARAGAGLRDRFSPLDKLSDFGLAVLAVNCAWHYYDDSGFWRHFCAALGAKCDGATQQYLGERIEAGFLIHSPGYRQRSGPFRFVGPILAHSGVSARYLPRFAQLFRILVDRVGLERLAGGTPVQPCAYYVEGLPRYLADYLDDASGREFIADVATALLQLKNGVIAQDQLVDLPGYRPEFWPLFYQELRQIKLRPRGSRAPGGAGDRRQYPAPYLYVEGHELEERQNETPNCLFPPFGRICVGNAESLSAGRFALIAEIDGAIQRIQTESENGRDFIDLDKLIAHPPAEIVFRVAALGRRAGGSAKEWRFVLLDKFAVRSPAKARIPPESGADIALEAPEGYTLAFSGIAAKKSVNGWHIAFHPSPVPAILEAGSIRLPVNIPVSWDLMRLENGAKILVSGDLAGQWIELSGQPGEEAVITIECDCGEKLAVHTGAWFGENGNKKINAQVALDDALKSWPRSWALLSQGSGSPAGSLLYINIPCLYSSLSSLAKLPEKFFKALPESAKSFCKLALAISGNGEFDAELIADFPLALQAISWHAAACAAFIDNRRILSAEIALARIDPVARYALHWYRWAGDTLAASAPIAENSRLPDPATLLDPDWISAVASRIEAFNNRLAFQNDTVWVIKEWLLDLDGPARLEYKSRLANAENGRELTDIWRQLLAGGANGWQKRAWSESSRLAGQNGLVGGLAKIALLALLRMTNRLSQMKEVDLTGMPQELRPDAAKLLGKPDSGPLILEKALGRLAPREKK